MRIRAALFGAVLAAAGVLSAAGGPARIPATSHGGVVSIAGNAGLGFASNQSNNWSGYNQGLLDRGVSFHEVSATWTIPSASQHRGGEAEYSATWVGIGGGCIDSGCLLTDATGLVQAGTEQDVDSKGRASYSAWWELIPAPAVTVSLPVSAGQRVHVDVAETVPGLWTLTITNLSTGQPPSVTTLPYASSHASAEWIEETPLIIGGDTGLAAMPNLSMVTFDPGTVNGGAPRLTPAEEIQLVDANGAVLATPSSPDSDTDGFDVCTYAGGCSVNPS